MAKKQILYFELVLLGSFPSQYGFFCHSIPDVLSIDAPTLVTKGVKPAILPCKLIFIFHFYNMFYFLLKKETSELIFFRHN